MHERVPTIEVEIGCTFEFDSPRATHAIVMVEPHFSEAARVVERRFELDPPSETSLYHDHFGNTCRRVDLAAGQVQLTFDALVTTVDEADPEVWDAVEVAPQRSARRRAAVPAAQPLLRVRRPRRRGVPPVRQCPPRVGAGAGRQRLGEQPPGVPVRLVVAVLLGARRVRPRPRGVPRLRPPGDHDVPGAEHPGALRVRLPARHRSSGSRDADGLLCMDGSVPRRRMAHVRSAQQRSGGSDGR